MANMAEEQAPISANAIKHYSEKRSTLSHWQRLN